MEPIFELAISVPPRGSRERLRSLHAQLRAAIVDGRLQPGLRLPPTRTLAAACGVSRNTVVATYDLLSSEGYLSARRGDGTYVAPVHRRVPDRKAPVADPASDRRLNAFWRSAAAQMDVPSGASPRFNFQLGAPDRWLFPFDVWRRLSTRTMRALSRVPATNAEPQGRQALREAISRHVSFARAVACRPEDIVVTAGAQQAFDLLARVLVTAGRTMVAMEDPGYPPARAVFTAAGAKIVPVPVDDEGLVVDRLPTKAGVIYVTPSHQFPLGTAMSMRRRSALLEFARTRRAVVIEDDYDGEFRFGGRPLDALQTLDCNESVFYVGTFSKSLFPAIRLGFVVPPRWARRSLVVAKQYADLQCPAHSEDTLAAFIAEGHLGRHVRKMRRIYDVRRQVLLNGLVKDFSGRLEPIPSAAGLHLTAFAQSSADTDRVVRQARQHDTGVYSLRRFYHGNSTRPGLVFGYGTIDERAITEGLSRLHRVWKIEGGSICRIQHHFSGSRWWHLGWLSHPART